MQRTRFFSSQGEGGRAGAPQSRGLVLLPVMVFLANGATQPLPPLCHLFYKQNRLSACQFPMPFAANLNKW